MSTDNRRLSLSLEQEKNEIIGNKDYSIILITDFEQKNDCCQIENIIENDSIQLVTGINKYDKKDQTRTEINHVISSAGILINEGVIPSYVFNPDRKEGKQDSDFFNLNQVRGKDTPQDVCNNNEKGLSTVTLYGDHIQLVSHLNGVNIYTTPAILSETRGIPNSNIGMGVSLIHGNSIETLEPMVKGESLDKYLKVINQRISEINHNVLQINTGLILIKTLLAAHTHITPQIPAGVTLTIPSIEAIISSATTTPQVVISAIDGVISEINRIINVVNNTTAIKGSFLSDHHKLN